MSEFNYSKFHIYDKRGHELSLAYRSSISLSFENKFGQTETFFCVGDGSTGLVSFFKYNDCGRFENANMLDGTLTIGKDTYHTVLNTDASTFVEYLTSDGPTYDIVDVRQNQLSNFPTREEVKSLMPTATFQSNLSFDKVSTGLIETQVIYFVVEGTDGKMYPANIVNDASISPDYGAWRNRYRFVAFTDCREQKNFQTFSVDSSSYEITLSNKQLIDLNDDFKINLSFSGDREGYYEEPLYIALIDISSDPENVYSDANDIYIIGSITLGAETEGEDERYRTLFANFGIPDVKSYDNIFNDSADNGGMEDYVSINKHSKQMFLSYSEIFPYVGTYKALVNAVNALGYGDEIFFKEWYKNLGNNTENSTGYVSFNVQYKHNNKANLITTKSLDERIKLKKLNWLSMMYRINKELENGTDRYGFPYTEDVFNTYDESFIIKLISLKRWLEKNVIGINCHITDVGGEGIYFERYKNSAYGNYQQVIEYDSEKNLAPLVEDKNYTLKDSSVFLDINIDSCASSVTIGELSDHTIRYFCEGYISKDSYPNTFKYHLMSELSDERDASIFIGSHISLLDNYTTYLLRAQTSVDDFCFCADTASADTGLVKNTGWDFILENNSFKLIPPKTPRTNEFSEFNGTPSIYIEHANFYSSDSSSDLPDFTISSGNGGYVLKHISNGTEQQIGSSARDYFTVSYDTLSLRRDNCHGEVLLFIENITLENDLDSSYGGFNDGSYYADILDGTIKFCDNILNRTVFINFEYDAETHERKIRTNILYEKNISKLCEYKTLTNGVFYYFDKSTNYKNFINWYINGNRSAISIKSTISLNVFNSGEYIMDVVAKNKNGDLFAARANKNILVMTPDVCMTTLSDSSVTGNSYIMVHGSQEEYNGDSSCANFELMPSYAISKNIDDEFNLSFGKRVVDDEREVIAFVNNKTGELKYDSSSGNTFTFTAISRINDVLSSLSKNDKIILTKYDTLSECDVEYIDGSVFAKLSNGKIKITLNAPNQNFTENGRYSYFVTPNDEIKVAISILDSSTFNVSSIEIGKKFKPYVKKGTVVKLVFYDMVEGVATGLGMSSFVVNSVNQDNSLTLRGDIASVTEYADYSQVFVNSSNSETQVITNDENLTQIRNQGTYVSYITLKLAHNIQVQYTFEKTAEYREDDGNIVSIPLTGYNRQLIKYIDNLFNVELRSFNPIYALNYWKTNYNHIQFFHFHCPVAIDKFAVCRIDSIPMFITPVCNIWKLYKDDGLLGEFFNDELQLDAVYSGIYSVGVKTYDKYGNAYSKYFDGAVTKK